MAARSSRLHAVQHDSSTLDAKESSTNLVDSPRAERARGEALAVGRARAAAALDSILVGRIDIGEWAASNCAIASRLGVSEKQIREYRSGDKALPVGALYAMPKSVALELLEIVMAEVKAR